MSWNQIKRMFVVAEDDGGPSAAETAAADLQKYELPPSPPPRLAPTTRPAALSGTIDFQALYDDAGIPNTDEVEALEKFLAGLDGSLPQASKIAAAKAFLNAIGKAPADVINDSGRKIGVVRAVGEAKRLETDRSIAERQAGIASLQRQIDEHRKAIEGVQGDLESVRKQCGVEEGRLQGARVFFGHVGDMK